MGPDLGSVGGLAAGLVVFSVGAVAVGQFVLYLSALVELRHGRQRDRHHVWRRAASSTIVPRITVVIPAYNEELTIRESTANILSLRYPNLEVVIVVDGATDDTLEVLQSGFDLIPIHPVYQQRVPTADVMRIFRSASEEDLIVVEKVNGGKADAMNVGLNVGSGELICFIDADTLIAPTALQQLAVPFQEDDAVVATGGMVRHTNGATVRHGRTIDLRAPDNMLAAAQAVEYLRAFLVGRLGWNKLGGNLLISGAFGLFRRERLLEIGGYHYRSVGEDMELVVRLRRRGYETGRPAKVVFMTAACSWTQLPESGRILAAQRGRWYRGLIDVLLRHKRMLFNPRYGTAGLLGMPYYFFVEFLAPVLEAVGMVLLLVALVAGEATRTTLLLVACSYLFGSFITLTVLIMDDLAHNTYRRSRDRFRLVVAAAIEQTALHLASLYWRLAGLWDLLRGRSGWGTMTRKQLSSEL